MSLWIETHTLHTSAKQVKKSAFRCAVTDERRLMFIVICIVVWCEERVNWVDTRSPTRSRVYGTGGTQRVGRSRGWGECEEECDDD